MILKRIYSLPAGLFSEVKFKMGMNFIYGKKDEGSPKSSLNSIGKSTFLDLIDFCLLASFQKGHNPRLFSAKAILAGYSAVLEFEIQNKVYVIKRSFDTPKEVFFGTTEKLVKYEIDGLRDVLAKLIFKRNTPEGYFSEKWFRSFMSFYLKIQKFKQDKFTDPIAFIKSVPESELNIYHMYLLGLNNELAKDNFIVKTDLKKIKPAIFQIDKLIKEKYGLKNLVDTSNNINKLRYEIKQLDEALESFHLEEEYKDVEKQANKLTQQIKDGLFQNFSDKRKVELYEESYKLPENISVTKIKNLYEELSVELAKHVKKALSDAITFRKKLSESRKTFLEKEIKILNEAVWSRSIEIKKHEEERAKLFKFLANKEAIKDLTDAFNLINEKKTQLSDLVANTKVLNDLNIEKGQIEQKEKSIEGQIHQYVISIDKKIAELYETFTTVYNQIYIDTKNQSNFSITFNKKKDKLIDINISMPDMYGKGKNMARTLIYDLLVMLNSRNVSSSFPRFLVHDGVFDGVDKAHFVALYEYIESLSLGEFPVQYITTINEEGTLSEKFGNSDKVSPEKIEQEAILILSPSNKLFGEDFTFND